MGWLTDILSKANLFIFFLTESRWAVRVSPAAANRMVDAARGVLNKFLPDIYIYTDHLKGNRSGK